MEPLKSLQGFSKFDATNVLSSMAMRYADRPEEYSQLVAQPAFLDRENDILNEIKSRMGYGILEPLPRETATEQIGNYLLASLLQNVDTDKTLTRAGQTGRLPLSMYSVARAPVFYKQARSLGVREQHILDTVKNPTFYEHWLSEPEPITAQGISIFARHHKAKGGYYYIVSTVRAGRSLQPTSAWRVFDDEINPISISSPIDLLRQFCELYGYDITFENETSKFFDVRTLPATRSNETIEWLVHASPDAKIITNTSLHAANNTTVRVGLFYAIDQDKYLRSLRRHHII